MCRRLPGAGAAQAAAATQERGAHPPAAGRGAPGHRAPQQGAPVPVQVVQPQSISVLSPNCEHCQHAGGGLTPPAPPLGL